MRKKDLKTGMSVELRNGDCYFVIILNPSSRDTHQSLIFVNPESFLLGLNYSDDLTMMKSSQFDIMSVSSLNSTCMLYYDSFNINEHRHLLWERNEPEEMTLEQVCKELGRDIKIIK